MNNIMKQLISPIAIAFILLLCGQANAGTLTTKQFKIKIDRNCEEGVVVCDRISYRGTDLRTGKSIRLSGKTVHTLCADKVTPCRFLGYEFRNNNYRYFVSDNGMLEIYQGKKIILSQQGTWES
jgi:hypothetical protein